MYSLLKVANCADHIAEEGYEVVCFLANVGQDEPWAEVEKKALKIGALKMVRRFTLISLKTEK